MQCGRIRATSGMVVFPELVTRLFVPNLLLKNVRASTRIDCGLNTLWRFLKEAMPALSKANRLFSMIMSVPSSQNSSR